MGHINHILSFLGFCCLLSSIKAKAINFTIWETEPDTAPWDLFNQQMQILKSGNEILNLRLDVIERNMEKQTQAISDNLEKIQRAMLQHHNMKDSDKYVSEIVPLEGVNDFDTSFDDTKTKSKCDVTVNKNIAEGEISFMTNTNGMEDPKICVRNVDDNTLICSDIVMPTNCAESISKACSPNKCYIQNVPYDLSPYWVSCDETTDGGGWTIIMRYERGSNDFDHDWFDYRFGFGVFDSQSFWIGLDKLYALTKALAPVELFVKLIDYINEETYAKYSSFAIGGEETKYVLKTLGSYSGNAGDILRYNQNMKFTTRDQDNDYNYNSNCAENNVGGWWYNDCLDSDRHGLFSNTDYSSYYEEIQYIQIMIRPREL